MKFGVFYAAPAATVPWEADSEYRLLQDASSRSSWPTASASTWCGRSSTASSRSTATPRRPRSSLGALQPADQGHRARSRDHPDRAGLQPTRARRLSGWRSCDLLSGGRVEFGSGESGSEAELGGFARRRTRRLARCRSLRSTRRPGIAAVSSRPAPAPRSCTAPRGSAYAYQGQRPLARGRSAGRPPRGRTACRRSRGRRSCASRRNRLRQPAHHHPHLLDLRAGGRHAGQPAAPDPARRRGGPAPRRPEQLQPDLRGRLRAPRRAAPSRWPSPDPVVVNFAGSETVSAEEYCAYLGELVGRPALIRYDADAPWPIWPDVDPDARGPRPDRGALARGHAAGRRGRCG